MTCAPPLRCFAALTLLICVVAITGCQRQHEGVKLSGIGDEIIVAGKAYHTGTRVITWVEKGGYNGYHGVKPFLPRKISGKREAGEREASAQWDLGKLQTIIDQFVIHYDGHGLSRHCFAVLQERQLSVHFLLDLDGTVYQTVDLQERALHATTSNDRSVGIEIANVGAFPVGDARLLDHWYRKDTNGHTHIQIPPEVGDSGFQHESFAAAPIRAEVVRGSIQGEEWVQYDFTAEQYTALIKLTSALCRLFPQIKNDYPRDNRGELRRTKLPDDQLAQFGGILGHYHIQTNKYDPGPAFQWDKLIEGVRERSK